MFSKSELRDQAKFYKKQEAAGKQWETHQANQKIYIDNLGKQGNLERCPDKCVWCEDVDFQFKNKQ
jgi:hypothetical protein